MESPPNSMVQESCIQHLFLEGLVQSLGKEIGRCQAPNPTRPISWPPLIVFQILIPLKVPLTYYFKLTHTNMHLTSKHGICLTLIHSIKPYHSSSNIYLKAENTSQNRNIGKALIIKQIHHVHKSRNLIVFTNQIKCMFM